MTVADAEPSCAFSAAQEIAPGVGNLFDRHQFAGLSGDYSADFPLNRPAGSYHVRPGVNP